MKLLALALLLSVDTPTPAPDTNSIIERAEALGVTTCLSAVRELSTFLIGGMEYLSHDTWSTDGANEHFFSSLIIKQYTDGISHITMTVVPRGEQCDWSYTETFTTKRACSDMRAEEFGSLSEMTSPGGKNTILATNTSLFFYLTDVENGKACKVSKREMAYQ